MHQLPGIGLYSCLDSQIVNKLVFVELAVVSRKTRSSAYADKPVRRV